MKTLYLKSIMQKNMLWVIKHVFNYIVCPAECASTGEETAGVCNVTATSVLVKL